MLSLNQEPQQADFIASLNPQQAGVVQELNDIFRGQAGPPDLLLGEWVMSDELKALPWNERKQILRAVTECQKFGSENHSWGQVIVGRRTITFGMLVLTLDGQRLSPDPSDPNIGYWYGRIELLKESPPWEQ